VEQRWEGQRGGAKKQLRKATEDKQGKGTTRDLVGGVLGGGFWVFWFFLVVSDQKKPDVRSEREKGPIEKNPAYPKVDGLEGQKKGSKSSPPESLRKTKGGEVKEKKTGKRAGNEGSENSLRDGAARVQNEQEKWKRSRKTERLEETSPY